MNRLTVILASGLFSSIAMATSLHPCTPRIPAMDTHIFCTTGDNNQAEVTIKTLMSANVPECRGKNHYEYQTATVEISDIKGNVISSTDLFSDEFTYSLSGPTGDATFESTKLGTELTKCVTPLHGAVSFGN